LLPQVEVLTEKSGPLKVKPLIGTAELPRFVKFTDWAALTLPISVGVVKFMLLCDREMELCVADE
jgi:hypothetical protein